MKNSFSTMRLWTASLLTLGAVLIQCPAQAQSIGPLRETYDSGKTWQPEGTGRPNRGSSGANSTPSVSPEEVARQDASHKANEEGNKYFEQRNWDAAIQAYEKALQNWDDQIIRNNLTRAKGGKVNKEGVEYYEQGNWDAAVQAFEKALQNWDHEDIRKNLANAKEQARLQQEHQRRDAAASASIKQSVDRLTTVLGNQSATGNFDSPATGTPRSGGGLDFITDPSAVLSKPAGSNTREPNTDPNVVDLRDAKTFTVDPARVKGAAVTPVPQQPGGGLDFITDPATVLSRPVVGNTREPNTDPNVVDLRDAKTFTVDPARVKGAATTPVPQQQSEKFSKAAGEALRDSLTAQQTGNPQAKVEADNRLQKLSQEELQQLAQWQAGAHQEMLDDMQMLQANGDKYVIALEEAKVRVRAKELTALKAADEKYHKDSSEYLRRLMGNEIKMKPGEVDAIIERRRAEQSAAVERAYYKMAAEVQHLKKQLLAETNGLPVIPSNPRTEKDMELLFSEPPPR